ncbi:MAG: CRISPR-associated endoribonuclease Cas6 [Calditrichaeota bacterium]|nr:CRISPR-associated endoribonuclease Cas6 [Calditrichota bacterium]
MRVKLTLRTARKFSTIPINYQYQLSSAIYQILSQSSPEFSLWLHEQGYSTPQGKPIKLFVFSKLYIPGVKSRNGALIARNFTPCTLHIESPMLQDFVQNFVIGLFSSQEISINSQYGSAKFAVQQVETVPEPEFSEEMKFKCLSPIVVSTARKKEGQIQEHYYRPLEPDLSEAIRKNLISKYETLYHRHPENDSLTFALDEHYLRRRGGEEKLSKLIKIKEGMAEETRIKAFECPFYLKGSTELMKVAYECGIGQKNSMGFGMVDVVK